MTTGIFSLNTNAHTTSIWANYNHIYNHVVIYAWLEFLFLFSPLVSGHCTVLIGFGSQF
jgi:hypothetical protein